MTHSDCYLGVDVGGTFTDFVLSVPNQNLLLIHKQPSTPEAPDRAVTAGVAALLEQTGIPAGAVARLAHGTTVGTNALIERRTGKVAIVTTKGFRDLLEIGRQTRPKMYDEHIDRNQPLVPRHLRFEVTERVLADGRVHKPLHEDELRALAPHLVEAKVNCVVVCFLHSYAYPAHELRAGAILREELPEDVHVITSASVYAERREYGRLSTAVLNAALVSVMNSYLDRIDNEMRAQGIVAALKVSHSAGGLMSAEMARRLPIRASLSGPAAGVLGAQRRAESAGFGDLITLDVGGTSADVSLLHGARAIEVYERELAGFALRLPAFDVNAVGAGGGSVAWIARDGLLKVGPRSAGAQPGPACYAQGGKEPTVTDANVVLGRLNRTALLDGQMPIDHRLAEAAIDILAEELGLERIETALGVVRVACATIVKAIRTISVERGYDPSDFGLFAFGGAGPLHATHVARELGISRVIVPPSPGILCAEGLLGCDLRADFVTTLLTDLDENAVDVIDHTRQSIREQTLEWFVAEEIPPSERRLEWKLDMRYRGQNYEISLPVDDAPMTHATCRALNDHFHQVHEATYGFASLGESVEIVNVKARAIGILDKPALPALEQNENAHISATRAVRFDDLGWCETPVWQRRELSVGQRLEGPIIIEQLDATVPIFPDDICTVRADGSLLIELALT